LVRLVDELNRHGDDLDFVIHTGDVVRDPNPRSFQLAAEVLSGLRCPLYVVNGNHDSAEGLRACFPLSDVESLTDDETVSYHFAVKTERFVVLDAHGPDEIDPAGLINEAQLVALEELGKQRPDPLTVFIHFPPVTLDSRWLDESMLIQNGDQLHAVFRSLSRLRGVFFGHVHRGMQSYVDGVLYCSVASTFCQFEAWPQQRRAIPNNPGQIFYNLVSLLPNQLVIKQLWQ
jgi:3',5'-cyclic AMP phosphodiesterase CpdA